MDDQTHAELSRKYPRLVLNAVRPLMARGMSRDHAWLVAGAIYAYTGIARIPDDIVQACGRNHGDFPKVVGKVNKFLRDGEGNHDLFMNLLEVLEGLSLLPDWHEGRNDPTRMMDAYDGIEVHYQPGNVIIMAEVGSVCRHRPAAAYYTRRYRLHFRGGLKDISAINPEQQEVIYPPGSAYLVESRHTGKQKEKKGNQAHEHIYLRYVGTNSEEYRHALAAGRVFDLRHINAR